MEVSEGDVAKLYKHLPSKYFKVLDKLVTDAKRAGVLEGLVYVDALTGLKNRRFYDEAVAEEVSRGNRREGNNAIYDLSLVLADIDHFKLFNDTYGHKAGDRVLQEVAKVCMGGVKRPTDVVARYGGEEIAFILPETSYDGAMHVAEGVRESIERNVMEFAGEDGKTYHKPVTVSMGVTSFIGGDTPNSLFERADNGLYLAKDRGRNRVVGFVNS